MIARLHAMYQRSIKIIIFPIFIFLALTLTSVALTAMQSPSVLIGSKLHYAWTQKHIGLIKRISGGCLSWKPSVHLDAVISYVQFHLDIWHWLGSRRPGSCTLGYCKTLSWTATILNSMGHWGLFHGVNKQPYILLYKVRSCFERDFCLLKFCVN